MIADFRIAFSAPSLRDETPPPPLMAGVARKICAKDFLEIYAQNLRQEFLENLRPKFVPRIS